MNKFFQLQSRALSASTSKRYGFGYVNKVVLVGNVGSQPDVRQISEERQIVSFPLATSESYKNNQTGEMDKKTQWHRVQIMAPYTAEFVTKNVTSGTRVYVEGKISYREYEKDGVKKNFTDIIVDRSGNIVVLSPKSGEVASEDVNETQ
ncbi:hypothetical protein MIR68_007385 [Amoeboaphelidium protococcarum]|nr:hypothetical protein MIR68_007385 [Amoeboaphelidium protococcarum]